MKKQIRKVLVSDKTYKRFPTKNDNLPKTFKPAHKDRCYCKDDVSSLEHKKRIRDDKNLYDFSRKTDIREAQQYHKTKDQSIPPAYDDDYLNEESADREQPRSDENNFDEDSTGHSLVDIQEPEENMHRNRMSPQDVETLRKFRDSNFFDCHSVKSRKAGLPKYDGYYQNEVNERISPDLPSNHDCRHKCCCCQYRNKFDKDDGKRLPHKRRDSVTASSSEEYHHPPCCCQNRARSKSSMNLNPRRAHRRNSSDDELPKRHGRELPSSSEELPKYILKIPEVCIKIPITDSMLISQKQSERNGSKHCKHRSSILKESREYDLTYKENKRRNSPEIDSLALRYQKGFRDYE